MLAEAIVKAIEMPMRQVAPLEEEAEVAEEGQGEEGQDEVEEERQQGEEGQQGEEEVPRVRGVPAPRRPDDEAVQQHKLTHLPYASWCRVCVEARGCENPRKRKQEEELEAAPVVETDYGFATTGEVTASSSQSSSPASPVLVAVNSHNGYGYASLSRAKGRSDKSAIKGMLGYFQEAGMSSTIRLRSDSEN